MQQGHVLSPFSPLLCITCFLVNCLIPPHQICHAACLSSRCHIEPIRLYNGSIVLLVGLAQFQGHGDLVVEVSKGAIQVEGVGVQDGLGGLLNFGFLRIGEGS